MGEEAFLTAVETTLDRIEDTLDATGLDLDLGRVGNVLQVGFDDGSKIIVNAQTPMRELWVATRSGGHHFRLEADHWLGTRAEGELFACLSRWVSAQGGQAVVLSPR
ncbi:MAG: hypothetical protein RL322_2391 [Pseudomonadota bacterium]|jgi:CyaY protein